MVSINNLATAFALLAALQPHLATAADVDESLGHCQRLLQTMNRKDQELRALTREASFLRSIGPRLRTTDGNRNAGLYRVETVEPKSGPAVLKIYKQEAKGGIGPLPSQLSELAPSLLLQAHLGKVVVDGYPLAPPVFGILNHEQVKALGINDLRGTPEFGVVMQYLEGVWNYPMSEVPCPFKGKLNAAVVRKRIHTIANEMARTRIIPRDFQLFVTADSRVYVADLDSFLFIEPNNKIHGGAWTVESALREYLGSLTTPLPMFTAEARQMISEGADRKADGLLSACAAEE